MVSPSSPAITSARRFGENSPDQKRHPHHEQYQAGRRQAQQLALDAKRKNDELLIDAKVTRGRPSWWLEEAFRGH